jgi:hypothetical protein
MTDYPQEKSSLARHCPLWFRIQRSTPFYCSTHLPNPSSPRLTTYVSILLRKSSYLTPLSTLLLRQTYFLLLQQSPLSHLLRQSSLSPLLRQTSFLLLRQFPLSHLLRQFSLSHLLRQSSLYPLLRQTSSLLLRQFPLSHLLWQSSLSLLRQSSLSPLLRQTSFLLLRQSSLPPLLRQVSMSPLLRQTRFLLSQNPSLFLLQQTRILLRQMPSSLLRQTRRFLSRQNHTLPLPVPTQSSYSRSSPHNLTYLPVTPTTPHGLKGYGITYAITPTKSSQKHLLALQSMVRELGSRDRPNALCGRITRPFTITWTLSTNTSIKKSPPAESARLLVTYRHLSSVLL